jgi:dihydroorotate dehydrogenase (NAD+) catalytic subunit
MSPDLSVPLGRLTLRNPLICGSGEHLTSLGAMRLAIDAGAAAVVAKSANESAAGREQSKATKWAYLDERRREIPPGQDVASASMLNRSGLVDQPWESWLETLAQADAHAAGAGAFVAASIIPADFGRLGGLVADVQQAGLRWIELNLSAPHSGEAQTGAIERPATPGRVGELTAVAREQTSAFLSVKLGAENHDVAALAGAALEAGADAVVMIGRHMGFLPDLETRRPVLGSFGGFSGPWALPLALRWVAKTRLALGPQAPIIGTNGARDGEDIARFLLSGASAVQVTTRVFDSDFSAGGTMLEELAAYLGRQGVGTAAELIGEAADAALSYQEAAMGDRA